MRRLTLLLSAIALSSCAANRDYSPHSSESFTGLFKLQVAPSFEHPKVYELSKTTPYSLNIKRYAGDGGYEWGEIEDEKLIEISEQQYSKILEQLRTALSAPVAEPVLGYDGSFWQLQSNLEEYQELSAWSPEIRAEDDRFRALLDLEKMLRKIENAIY